MNKLVIVSCLLLLCASNSSYAQHRLVGCPPEGDNPRFADEDRLKSRSAIPHNYRSISFSRMAAMKYTSHVSEDQAVQLTGYVIEVKWGGKETVNCKSNDELDYDIHIMLSASEDDLDRKHGIVVELTPRILEKKFPDWDKKAVKDLFYHKWVTVSGYLFNDKIHFPMSAADDANPGNTHRATCWEIHPVTNIEEL